MKNTLFEVYIFNFAADEGVPYASIETLRLLSGTFAF